MMRDNGIHRGAMRLIAAGAVCGLFAVFAGHPAIAQQKLSGNDARTLMAGTTIAVESGGGYPMVWNFREDGRLDGEVDIGYDIKTDDGKWWINKRGRFCYQWTRWAKGKKRCPGLAAAGKAVKFIRRNGRVDEWPIKTFGPRARQIAFRTRPKPRRDRQTAARAVVKRAVVVAVDKAPPRIEAPQALSTSTAVLQFDGRVRDASQILEVTVDGRPVPVSDDGSFTVRRGVVRGNSSIEIVAIDEWGNRATRRVSVSRTTAAPKRRVVASAGRAGQKPAAKKADPFAGIYFGNYHALIIGNNKYKSFTDLKSAVPDAEAVGAMLQRDYGFTVSLLKNATRSEVIGGLARMRAKLKANDSLLIYYAGHGIVDDVTEQGYWLPVDAENDNPANWISTNDITTMLRGIQAKHVMVVADSCYSGTLVRAVSAKIKTAKQRRKWIERMSRKRARTALVSGGLEPVMDSGGGGHSVFARAFLDALAANRSVMEGEALFDAIKRPVVLNSDQTPQYSDVRKAGHEGGDFLFVRRGS